ncbi:MAG: glycosyltransferase family 39 protein [Vicinamibacterales bacterium]
MSSRTDEPEGPFALAVAAVLAIAALLRLPGLDAQLWYDEIATLVISVRQPLATILTDFPGVNQHPLYSVLSHASIGAFGESPWALRLPAALFGVVAVWTVWDAGRLLLSRTEALAAAVLVATSSHHVWFSQNARGYTMLATFTLLSTALLVRLADRHDRRLEAAYVACAVAGVYTHLTMAFVLVAHVVTVAGAWALGSREARRYAPARLAVMWAVTIALIAATYAPYLPELLATFAEKAPPQAAKVATAGRAAGDLLRGVTEGFGVVGLLVAVVSAVVGGLALLRARPFVVWLLVMPAVTTVGLTALMGQPIRPRFVFNLSGAAALFVAFGASLLAGVIARRLGRQSPAAYGAALVGLLLTLAPGAAAALARNAAVPKQDFEGPLAMLDAASAAGRTVVGAGAICLPLQRYFERAWPCAETDDAWQRAVAGADRVLAVHTLIEFWHDPALVERMTRNCRDVRRFPGTLGGGDVVVCEPREAPASAAR